MKYRNNLFLYADTSPHLTKSGTKTLNNFWPSVFERNETHYPKENYISFSKTISLPVHSRHTH